LWWGVEFVDGMDEVDLCCFSIGVR
jgi:hypothetical protein